MDVTHIIDVLAPPERVWNVLVDVARWPEWTPSVRRAELLDGDGLAVGRRVRIRQPRLPVAVWTVTDLHEGGSFEWQSIALGVRTAAGHRVEAIDGGTRVTLTVAWDRRLAPVTRLVFGRLTRRYVATEAQGLKARCELAGRSDGPSRTRTSAVVA